MNTAESSLETPCLRQTMGETFPIKKKLLFNRMRELQNRTAANESHLALSGVKKRHGSLLVKKRRFIVLFTFLVVNLCGPEMSLQI